MLQLLDQAEALRAEDRLLRSTIRYSSLGAQLFVHSAFPTLGSDDVFFGPDTYRFARTLSALAREYPHFSPRSIIDIGTGSGAGGLAAARAFPSATRVLLGDINENALEFASANALLNGRESAEIIYSDGLSGIAAPADLIIANPPYLVDPARRAYRHGGGIWGFDLSLRFVREALEKLRPGGKILIYTGTPVIRGVDVFRQALSTSLKVPFPYSWRYDEIDSDVFGEELENEPYDEADRIAVVCLLIEAKEESTLIA
jgi:methylase of polypeptide subunit release factors